jgi:hypothetical protein
MLCSLWTLSFHNAAGTLHVVSCEHSLIQFVISARSWAGRSKHQGGEEWVHEWCCVGGRVTFLAHPALRPLLITVYVTRMTAEDAQKPPNTHGKYILSIAEVNILQNAALFLFSTSTRF